MPVTVHDWPSGVPECVFPLSPQGGYRDNRLSFDVDGGFPPIERPSSSWAPEVYSVELTHLSIPQFQAFQTWYRVTLGWGVEPFKLDHPITKVRAAWKIVKADPPYQVTKARRVMNQTVMRGIALSFRIMSMPYSFDPDFMAQEQGDLILQEQGDRIIIRPGFEFGG